MEADIATILPKGRYEILRAMARGASGAVYSGIETASRRRVALKLLYLPGREALSRIDREIEIAKKLKDNQYVVSIDEAFFAPDGKSAVLVSEWIDGPSIENLVEHNGAGLPLDVVVSITRQLVQGLTYVHQNGVVHRDIKPSNVLITRDGMVKLCDFGIAVSTADLSGATTITSAGSFVGTLRYAAPEMLAKANYCEASDVYALGMTVLFMQLGHNPLPDGPVPYVVEEILSGSIVSDFPQAITPDLKKLLITLLDVQPDQRPSANDLLGQFNETFPQGSESDEKVITNFLLSVKAIGTALADPPRVVTSALEPDEANSTRDLIRSLEQQLVQVQSAVSDITAAFSREALIAPSPHAPDSAAVPAQLPIEKTFETVRRRLAVTWRVSLLMTFVLFALFIGMVVLAAICGLVYQKSFWGIIFGGSGVASLLTVFLWRPMDKMFLSTIATQQLELIQINYYKALTGSKEERREAFRDVSTQLQSLLKKMSPRDTT